MRALRRVLVCSLAGAALLAGCGDSSDGGDESSASGTGGSGNRAPVISGSPTIQVAANAIYSFTPTASDPDGDALQFSIVNTPSWASFNQATGRLSGTPGLAQVGNYANIRISVSDGRTSTTLPAFTVSVVAIGTGVATLSWTAPQLNTDGSALTDLDGFRIYWGPAQGYYTNSVPLGLGQVTYVVEGLTLGTWYFAATAVNSLGIESSFSNVAVKTISQ